MRKTMKYTVLRYFPSKIAGESINLGIIFVSEDNEERAFAHVQKWNRLKAFDDEVNLDLVKLLLEQIKDDVDGTLLNCEKKFELERYIRNYVNEFSFGTIERFPYESFQDAKEQIQKLYLRFDYDKKARLNKSEEKEIIERILCGSGLDFKKRVSVTDELTDTLVYDYMIGDYGIKFLNLDNKNLSRMMQTVRAWAWTCANSRKVCPVIILNYTGDAEGKTSEQMQSVHRILKSASEHVYNIEEGIAFLNRLQKNMTVS